MRWGVFIAASSALLLAGMVYWTGATFLAPPVNHLDWVEEGGYRWAALDPPARGGPGFEKLDGERLGIDFTNTLTEDQIAHNRNLLNGSGTALGDVTGNGFVDIYLARLHGPNVLYENQGGWRFRDISEDAGVALPGQFSTGAVFADLNGSGALDLVVSSNDGPNRVLLNDGEGRFRELEGALDTERNYGSTSIAVADVTGNGALDLYIANYKERSVRDIWPYEQEFRFIVERVDDDYRVQEKYEDHYRLAMRDSILIWFEEGEEDLLYLNDGEANFSRAPLDSGILHDEDGEPITEPLRDWGLHAKFQDINQNGLPDLYVANDFETPDRIWLNRGDGTFRALPRLSKRKSSLSSMAVDFSDINRNGLLDFFVVEMLSRHHEKRIRQITTMAPSPQPIGAIDNRPLYQGNTLFLDRGDGTYAELSEHAEVRRSDWTWSTYFLDVNLNGYEDILIATGHHYDVQDADASLERQNRIASGTLDRERAILTVPPLEERNALFRNRGDGTFEEVTEEWGFTEGDVTHGMALADLDNSGSPDVVMNRLDYPAAIYRNRASGPRVQVRLRGRAPNTKGVGSKIHFHGGPTPQVKEVEAGGSYLSGSEPTYVFATGDEEGPFTIEVEWRDGERTLLEDIRRNRIYEIDHPDAEGAPDGSQRERRRDEAPGQERPAGPAPEGAGGDPEEAAEAPEPLDALLADFVPDPAPVAGPVPDPEAPEAEDPFFEDVSGALDHAHHENEFRDWRAQPLIPYRLSRLGPGVAWFDATGDGLDDLFVGSGAGGEPAWFRNQGDGEFERVRDTPFDEPAQQDQVGLVGWWEGEDEPRFLAGSANFETGDADAESVHHFRLGPGAVERLEGLAGSEASTGPLAMADYTGNGHLDLFVGGRVVSRRYPEAASSRLYRNEGDGTFVLDEENAALLEDAGLVTGAVFTDLTGDGAPELVLSRAWDSPMALESRDGRFRDVTGEWGLSGYHGWWTGVTAGDLNGNGRMDLVVGNWGTNHPWAATSSPDEPVRIHHADFTDDGVMEVIEAYHAEVPDAVVPRRGLAVLWGQLRFIEGRIRTYREYGTSSLEQILGQRRLEATSMVEAGHFEHMVFWNREDGFEAEPLPEKAQWAPAFHVAVTDLSGDGNEDIFLSQNFFAYELETPRSDGGRALWLRGDGSGGFEPVPGHESGILVYGEQRGAALSDFDGDGRVDIAVSQNGARTKLLENRGAEPGLRVRLDGPGENPRGVGARVRLEYAGGSGPAREVRAGSGYWSQDSAIQVMGRSGTPVALRVRWPGGEERRYELPADAAEVTAGVGGSLEVLR